MTCLTCSQAFEISALEEDFLQRGAFPLPHDCPACRRQQRLLFRNFFHLYHRTCDLTGKKIISMYDADAPFPVYATQVWWSDQWDALSYGESWNPEKSFVEQLETLHRTVPRMAMVNTASENTEFCNLCSKSSNCYLVHGCVNNEDCMYGHIVWRSKNCFDCLYLYESEYCVECIDCVKCYSLAYAQDCDNCSDSKFLTHCVGCRDCFGCVGLKNKQYYIFNEQHTAESYRTALEQLNTGSSATMHLAKERVQELLGAQIVKYYHGFGCENVTGDYLYNCSNIVEGYDLKRCEDSAHLATCEGFTDCFDCNFSGTPSEHSYQGLTLEGYGLIGCHTCMQSNANLLYCDNCYSCQDCIGCISLKNKKYCILNTQYSEADYMTLKIAMIDHMKRIGLWGRFLPASLSPFGYNETIAHHYFPLSEEQAHARGWKWKARTTDPEQQYLGPENAVPDDIRDTTEETTKHIFRCEVTGKLFKILPQELAFYRSLHLPLPRRCFEQRHKDRIALRNPRKLWNRECATCHKPIATSYAPERPETVVCEECYLKSVY